MFVKIFKQISKKDVDVAGGKGASLGEMTRSAMPIPPGFLVLVNAFDDFFEESGLVPKVNSILNKINYKNITSVEKASEKIRDLINGSMIPDIIAVEILKSFKELKTPLVAVRSSATVEDSVFTSWAGELESYMNVGEKDLLAAIKNCWSSLFTPRAIFYSNEKGLNKKKISVAVVVQEMVQSEVSGIVFTAHPVTEKRDCVVIEAGYGLGEAIVGGEITPDTYIFSKKKKIIISKNISNQSIMIVGAHRGVKRVKVLKSKQEKQKLSDKKIIELVDICLNIERHYKKPQDIEWAFEKGKLYITQSRPITTLS